MSHEKLQVGDQAVFYSDESESVYTVQCRSERFIICTAPVPNEPTCWYTIIDLERDVRGADNMVFGNGYETPEQCAERLAELVAEKMEVSYRNFVPLVPHDKLIFKVSA